MTVLGSAIVTLNNCTASTNSSGASSFYLDGHGKLAADCATTVGGADTGSGLNLTCNNGDVITSAQAAATVVAERWGAGARVLPVGTPKGIVDRLVAELAARLRQKILHSRAH